jgi:hypothetical protein
MPQSAPARAPRAPSKPAVSPRGGPAGSEVTVTVEGTMPFQNVRFGFGSLSQYQVIGRADSDGGGKVTVALRIPDWAEVDRLHYVVASFGNEYPRVVSEPLHVTDADGTARIYGTISEQGMSCLNLDGPEKTLYTLEGETGLWSAGQRVSVIGTVGSGPPSCGGPGLPILVREIRPNL